jgi:cysteine sulfinate desulfinase/cysteine desulfurase-like protein
VAGALAGEKEIVFASGATESDNLAILASRACREKGVTSSRATEHTRSWTPAGA